MIALLGRYCLLRREYLASLTSRFRGNRCAVPLNLGVRCHLPDRSIKLLADSFLHEAAKNLSALSFSELSTWPEYPAVPDSGVVVPEQLGAYTFTVMKDSRPDGSIRVAIQRYRKIFGPVGEMVADGFFIHPTGEVTWMSERDLWEVT